MPSLLSGYWAATHDHKPYLDYYRKLQPADILILQPDVQQISDAYMATPESTITLRRWDWDDNRSDQNPGIYPHLQSDPEGYARWLVDQYAAWVPQLEQQAKARGVPFPAREQLVAHHVNEPDTNYLLPQINRSTVVAARLFRERLGMGCDMLNIGTGQPALLNSHGEPDWSPLAEALDACVRYDHPAVTHEYFNDLSMTDASIYPWHIGRHAKWAPRGPRWKIGEFGLEMLVNNRRDDHHGWQGVVSEDEMIRRVGLYLGSLRDDVEAARWYMDDYADRKWRTFDSQPLHDQLLVVGWRYPSQGRIAAQPQPTQPQHSIFLPSTPQGSQQAGTDVNENWRRSREFVARWEGGWADHPADMGGPTNKGITWRTFVNWRKAQGMGEPSIEDLRDISDDETDAIYYTLYWKPSGAAVQPWPKCLVTYDTAVLHGVEAAQWFLSEVGGSALGVLGLRLLTYAASIDRDASQEVFWQGWRNRTMEVRAIVREAAGQPV